MIQSRSWSPVHKMLHKAGDKVEAEANREPSRNPSNPDVGPVTR